MRLLIPSTRCGFLPRVLTPLLGVLVLMASQAVAQTQLTVQDLLDSVVAEIGPQHKDVEDAIELFQRADPEGALSALRRAQQADPKLPPAEVLLAKMYFISGNLRAAEQALERAIQQSPNDPEAYVIQGDLALQTGKISQSQLSYEQGLRLLNSYTANDLRKKQVTIRAMSGLSLVANSTEDWKGSEGYLRKWLELDSENVIAKERLSYVLFRQGDQQGAYRLLQEVYTKDHERTRPEVALARLFDSVANDKARAEQLMRHAFERDKDNLKTQVAVAEWALESSKLELARQAAARAQTIDPNSIESMLINGMVALFDKKHDLAIQNFEKAHLQSPTNAVANNHLALLLIERTNEADRRRAVEFARVNASLYSQSNQRFAREAAITLAWVYHKLGQSGDGLRILNRVLAQAGSVDSTSLYLAAQMLHDVNEDAAAKKLLDAILESGVNFLHRELAQQLRTQIQ